MDPASSSCRPSLYHIISGAAGVVTRDCKVILESFGASISLFAGVTYGAFPPAKKRYAFSVLPSFYPTSKRAFQGGKEFW